LTSPPASDKSSFPPKEAIEETAVLSPLTKTLREKGEEILPGKLQKEFSRKSDRGVGFSVYLHSLRPPPLPGPLKGGRQRINAEAPCLLTNHDGRSFRPRAKYYASVGSSRKLKKREEEK